MTRRIVIEGDGDGWQGAYRLCGADGDTHAVMAAGESPQRVLAELLAKMARPADGGHIGGNQGQPRAGPRGDGVPRIQFGGPIR